MANLKELKTRITSVKSTQKITSAMKMVAASRLKRAQEAAEASRPYAERMASMMGSILKNQSGDGSAPKLLSGSGAEDSYLFVVFTSDRGLCGGFNSNICREIRKQIRDLQGAGKQVKLLCVGRKGRDQLKDEFGPIIIDTIEGVGRRGVTFAEAEELAARIIGMFEDTEFDVCIMAYNKFISVISQLVTSQTLIPIQESVADSPEEKIHESDSSGELSAVYEFEPSEAEILSELLPSNLKVQLFKALLESSASEHGARMSAMDNATRNAGDMIEGLTLTFNRTRQAKITSELIEIISGAEAL